MISARNFPNLLTRATNRPNSRFIWTGSSQSRRIRTNALFSGFEFLKPSRAGGSSQAKREQLLDTLLRLTDDCDAGFKTSESARIEIASVVQELSAFCPSKPLSRRELFGRWQVRYASKPTTAGGPFKTLPGRVFFPGQIAIQEIDEPDVIVNEISFKTLGFVPGSVRQVGTWSATSSSTFEIDFPNSTKKVGGPKRRTIELVYLDENVRIARAVPREEGQDGSFYVFQREGIEFEFEGNVVVEDDFAGKDRAVPAPTRSAEEARLDRARAAEERAAAAEQAKLERAAAAEQAKLERAAAAEQAKMEREALASRKAAAKERYNELSSEARESTLAAQATAKELGTLERDAAKMIRDAANARRSIEKAEQVVGALVEKLLASQADESALNDELRANQRDLAEVRAQLTKIRKALSPK